MIILFVATVFMQFRDNYYVNLIFSGITAAVPMLVLAGVVSLLKGVNKNISNLIVGIIALIALVVFDIHPVIVIICSAIYGMVFLREKVG